MTVAGLKKWMPQTRSGREVARARSMTGSVEVLVARIAVGLVAWSSSREQRHLDGDLLDHRLDHQVAFAEGRRSLRWR